MLKKFIVTGVYRQYSQKLFNAYSTSQLELSATQKFFYFTGFIEEPPETINVHNIYLRNENDLKLYFQGQGVENIVGVTFTFPNGETKAATQFVAGTTSYYDGEPSWKDVHEPRYEEYMANTEVYGDQTSDFPENLFLPIYEFPSGIKEKVIAYEISAELHKVVGSNLHNPILAKQFSKIPRTFNKLNILPGNETLQIFELQFDVSQNLKEEYEVPDYIWIDSEQVAQYESEEGLSVQSTLSTSIDALRDLELNVELEQIDEDELVDFDANQLNGLSTEQLAANTAAGAVAGAAAAAVANNVRALGNSGRRRS